MNALSEIGETESEHGHEGGGVGVVEFGFLIAAGIDIIGWAVFAAERGVDLVVKPKLEAAFGRLRVVGCLDGR